MSEDRTVFLVPYRDPQGTEGPPFVRSYHDRDEAEQFAKSVGSFVSEAEELPPSATL